MFPVGPSECVWVCLHMCAADEKVCAWVPACSQMSRFTTCCLWLPLVLNMRLGHLFTFIHSQKLLPVLFVAVYVELNAFHFCIFTSLSSWFWSLCGDNLCDNLSLVMSRLKLSAAALRLVKVEICWKCIHK